MKTIRTLTQALAPLASIANAYLENHLGDEARRFWGAENEHENQTPPEGIELFSGRGGRELLCLSDCFAAKQALASGHDLDAALEPLVQIARAYHANEIDDEGRKFWGPNLEHRNTTPWSEIVLVSDRAGRPLLTLEDAIEGSAARAAARGEASRAA